MSVSDNIVVLTHSAAVSDYLHLFIYFCLLLHFCCMLLTFLDLDIFKLTWMMKIFLAVKGVNSVRIQK